MKHKDESEPGLTAKDARRQQNQAQNPRDQRRDISSPGGGGSQDRVPAKGNDITREEDRLQTDIDAERDAGAAPNAMREVERKRDDNGQEATGPK